MYLQYKMYSCFFPRLVTGLYFKAFKEINDLGNHVARKEKEKATVRWSILINDSFNFAPK